MSRIRSSGTKPEVALEGALRKRGLRFSTQVGGIVGTPDFANKRRKIVVFVHGCFWHGHSCQGDRVPERCSQYWADKIVVNRRRDRRNTRKLRADGWKVLTVWECRIRSKSGLLREAQRVARAFSARLLGG
jgi:DNA mismatch endonuclease (patch repair protein)